MTVETVISDIFDRVRQIEAELIDTRLFWLIAGVVVANLF